MGPRAIIVGSMPYLVEAHTVVIVVSADQNCLCLQIRVTAFEQSGGVVASSRSGGEITAAAKNGSILQLHHPEHGWLAFVFPPEHAAILGVALLRHSGVCDFRGTLPPSTVTV